MVTTMKQARVISNKEFKILMSVISSRPYSSRNRLALMLSFFAGMRVGEIASLKYGDAFNNKEEVREIITLEAKNTKGKDARDIYISKKLRKELERYQDNTRFKKADLPLIVSQRGSFFSGNSLCQLFGRLYNAANVDGASSHSGRRKFITEMAHKGVSPKVIMTLAGHKNLSTTSRYINVTPNMMKEAVELL